MSILIGVFQKFRSCFQKVSLNGYLKRFLIASVVFELSMQIQQFILMSMAISCTIYLF